MSKGSPKEGQEPVKAVRLHGFQQAMVNGERIKILNWSGRLSG